MLGRSGATRAARSASGEANSSSAADAEEEGRMRDKFVWSHHLMLPLLPLLRDGASGLACMSFLCVNSSYIQLTPQKLSAGRKNLTGAPGAGEWPEDQKRHRGRRRPGRRRYRSIF